MDYRSVILEALEPFRELFEAFRAEGYQLYAVGGCVRDWVLGKVPKDVDFTTDALPEQTKAVLSKHGWKVIPVGEVFGTIATLIHRKQYEITTFRVKESYTRGSRHPIVCYGRELSKDLERRDLTINAMAASEDGTIIDPYDGLGDISRRVLRVPSHSYAQALSIFGDDPLRMLRLARFKARLGFEADVDATRAAADMAGAILTVSHERWFAEIDGLLRAPEFISGISWLVETGIWPLIMPEFRILMHVKREPVSLSDGLMRELDGDAESLWGQTLARVGHAPVVGDLRWASLFSMLGYAYSDHASWADETTAMLAGELMLRLKFSSARIEQILKVLKPLPAGVPSGRVAREFAILLGNAIRDWRQFQDVRVAALSEAYRSEALESLARWDDALAPYYADPSSAEVVLPKALSQALTEALGVRGKTLGLCIAQCRDAVLDQCLSETDDVEIFVKWVREHFEN
ncbi:MAG: CCA tRNA nucleotidyltransferase [Proteobacteria bacterium]|nr:CCA tRNA nucleotidyltransferase [Pseudomonadota bacterium]